MDRILCGWDAFWVEFFEYGMLLSLWTLFGLDALCVSDALLMDALWTRFFVNGMLWGWDTLRRGCFEDRIPCGEDALRTGYSAEKML